MTDQFIGKILAQKYRIDSPMRDGEWVNLYHGTHLLMEKPVAIKVLPAILATDETIVKNFSDEARTVSRISHPNILNVTDYGSDVENGVFIIYEDASGETLKENIKQVGRYSLKRANKILKEIASVLSVAHSNEIIHQNLSSENILFNQQTLKILNFGISTFDINDLDYPIEKIQYLAPEQCALSGKVDNRTDVYALGVILYEMLAGEVPFTANNGTDLMFKLTQEPPPPITAFRNDLPNEVDDILLKALAKNPEIRYQNVNEFADELNQVSLLVSDSGEEETVVAQRFSAANGVAVPEKSQNNLWKTAFIVLAGITLLGGSFIYMTSGKQTNPTTQLQTDANGSPVQPAPPPTGATEQTLANMDSYNPNVYSNSNTGIPDGGGSSNPYWDQGKLPPGVLPNTTGGYGQPFPVQPSSGGQQVYVDPANGSIFMPTENNTFVQMVPKNNNTTSNVNTQPKKNSNTNANVSTAPANTTVKPSPTPTTANTETPDVKPTATPKTKASPKPVEKPSEKTKPETNKPATTEKRPVSGKTQDTQQF